MGFGSNEFFGCIRQGIAATGALLLVGILPQHAFGQQKYPERPVSIVVPAAAGGATDTVARLLADELTARLGQPVTVDNRPGAGGISASVYLLNQEADGHTLLLSTSSKAIITELQAEVPYSPLEDLVTISPIASIPTLLVVPAKLGIKNFEEFKASLAGETKVWGVSGRGNAPHIAGTVLLTALGTNARYIAYASSSELHPDLIEGRLHFSVDSLSAINAHMTSGAVVPIAVVGQQRLPAFPDLPTLGELGFEHFTQTLADGWNSIDVKKGTDDATIALLHKNISEILTDAEFQARLTKMHMMALEPMSLQEGADFVTAASEAGKKVVSTLDIK